MHLVTIAAVLSAALATAAPAAAPSSSVYATISNHITACPGKFHEVCSDRIEQWKFKLTKFLSKEEDLLLTFVEKVKKNEPGVLEFQVNSAKANSSFLTYEKYVHILRFSGGCTSCTVCEDQN